MRMRVRMGVVWLVGMFIIGLGGSLSAQAQNGDVAAPDRPSSSLTLDESTVPIAPRALHRAPIRSIGPAVTGGRIHDVEALPDDPETVYVATASGGLWKSTNGGTTWASLFDDQPVSTFGDLAIAPSTPEILWAGTGEQNNRQSTSWGNGVYRSTDGGASWTHTGLDDTHHIGRVQVHPDDPATAFVAALGTLWAPSDARGVYKTTDGGQSWEKVLFIDRFTGVVDLAMDPSNPDVLYAAAYQRLRRTWGFNGGGPGSGIYKSTDGGTTWTELTNGLPDGDKGRIGLSVSPANPQTVYALIEHADEGGTYRSRDGGASWTKVNDLNPRPMYYSHVAADPVDPDRLYVLATEAYTSTDGGAQFTRLPTRPTYDLGVHSDHHSIWIDPNDPDTFYLAGDAGLHITHDRGQTYRRINNLPIGQFYAIGVDRRTPYTVYGGMQDNHSWMGPSGVRRYVGIINDDWKQTGFGDGMYQSVAGPRAVFVGSQNGGLTRVDPVTGDRMDVEPLALEEDEDLRFDWVTPTLVSQHDSSVVYLGGNRLFISRDRGQSWSATEDLTKAIDRSTLSLMGVPGDQDMLSKHDGTASFSEITTIAESPLDPNILWVGTDDGNVQVSRDGGDTWTRVDEALAALPGAPDDTTYVSRVAASATSPGTAYVTLDAHRDGDFAPYVYRTTDFGATWTARTDGLDPSGSVNVILEHPDAPEVLFLGTEHALYVSTTAGAQWAKVGDPLPTMLVDDLAIQPDTKDLVIGTHGHSLWIWDDTTPLVEWARTGDVSAYLFSPQPATLSYFWKNTSYRGQAAYAGTNDPHGALLHYHLEAPADSVTLTIRNPAGDVVRTLTGPGTAHALHQVRWDLEHPAPPYTEDNDKDNGVAAPDTVLPAPRHPLAPQGPFVRPGVYTVTLQAGDVTSEQKLTVRPDPEVPVTALEWNEREAFLLEVLAVQRQTYPQAEAAERMADSLQARVEQLDGEGAVPEALAARADSARAHADRLDDVRDDVYGLASVFNMSGVTQPTLQPPRDAHRTQLSRLAEEARTAGAAWEAFRENGAAGE